MELAFSQEEYAQRVRRVRERMGARGIDVLLVTAAENWFYLTGFDTGTHESFLVLVLPCEGDAHWVVRRTELSNVRAHAAVSWVKEGAGVADGEDAIAVLARRLCELGHEHARIGVDRRGRSFTAAQQHALGTALSRAQMRDGSGIVEELRRIKSESEIEYLRRAGAITASSLRAGIEAVGEGVTDREIGATLLATAIREGSEPMAGGPFVTVGARSALAHSTWIGHPIARGELVNTEMACVVARYNTPAFRVSVVGAPGAELARFHAASEAGLEAALTRVRPGMSSHEADRIVRAPIERAGLGEYFVVRAAYGIGLAFSPGWGEDEVMSIRPADDRTLEPGMCFHVVPALYKDGFGAVCCSMPVVLTGSGFEPLVDLDPRLFVR